MENLKEKDQLHDELLCTNKIVKGEAQDQNRGFTLLKVPSSKCPQASRGALPTITKKNFSTDN